MNIASRILFALSGMFLVSVPLRAEPQHAIAMHGEPAHSADFTHLPYANPDAPKGGSVTYCVIGSFDNLNPFIIKSLRTTARGMIDTVYGNLVFEPLMQRSFDEPFTLYGLIAESIETSQDRSWAIFRLNKSAKWSDGKPITAEDVIFTYNLFQEKGRPPYSTRLKRVAKMEMLDAHTVRFDFNEKADREFPLIVGLTPVLPKHATDPETFDQTTLKPMIGSGPYIVAKVDPGERIIFERNKHYWAKDLPIKRGFDNYDRITIEYYRDATTRFEAFKKGLCHFQPESDPKRWINSYNFPAANSGQVRKSEFQTGLPAPMSGFIFNTRRPVFRNRDVREAIAMLYDFEGVNQNLYLNQFERLGSYWQNSELSAYKRPAEGNERSLISQLESEIDPAIADGSYRVPKTDGSGQDRTILAAAFKKLTAAGYEPVNGKMVGPDGKPLSFEILVGRKVDEELALAFKRNFDTLGLSVTIRLVDDAQMQQRRQAFDYDMIAGSYSASLSPGIEQSGRWGSAARDLQGSFNFAGANEPDIDAIIDKMVQTTDRAVFVDTVRVLDRLLMNGHYIVPMQYNPKQWLAHWARFRKPDRAPLYGYHLPAWWSEE